MIFDVYICNIMLHNMFEFVMCLGLKNVNYFLIMSTFMIGVEYFIRFFFCITVDVEA